jgi:Na+-transporting methylmalonyl-CoA/oxaloacetate decarboxylase gamma subunit
MGVVFLMLMVLVQVSLAMSARSAADAAVSAAARRAALPGADPNTEATRLTAEIGSVVPGATDVVGEVEIDTHRSRAAASFTWVPPGPVLVPIAIRTTAEVLRATPP